MANSTKNSDPSGDRDNKKSRGLWLFLVPVALVGVFFVGYNVWENRKIMVQLAAGANAADQSKNSTKIAEHARLWLEVERLKLELAAGQNNTAKDQQKEDEVQQLHTQLEALKKELENTKQKETSASSVEQESSATVDGLKKELEAAQAKLAEAQNRAAVLQETATKGAPGMMPKEKEAPAKITYWPSSLIHDTTLDWDPTVYRPWLNTSLDASMRPPAMILFTNYGWNQPDQTKGLLMLRSIRESDLYTGVINHPWFHPTLWKDLEDGKIGMNDLPQDVQYFVFVDLPQCGESNWPIYGGGANNTDKTHGRGSQRGFNFWHPTQAIKEGKLFQAKEQYNLTATAISFNCKGFGTPPDNDHQRSNATWSKWPMSVVSLSSLISNSDERYDQGLIAPAGKPVKLSKQQEWDIQTCEAETKRSLYVTYAGNFRCGRNPNFHARGAFQKLNDNKRLFIARYFNGNEFNQSKLSEYSYEEFLADTVFALAPRGDNKFSYRFTEVLSAGAIPVILADDWVWPFRPELVDWKQCAVILPEKDAGEKAIAYLDSITEEERCRMRQNCRAIYKDYVETPVKQIDGIVKGLVWKDRKGWDTMKLQGIRCDTFDDPAECNLLRRR